MSDIKHIILESLIYKNTLFGGKKLLPKDKQIIKHVIGPAELVNNTEDKFLSECERYTERLNRKNIRVKYNEDNEMENPKYTCNSFITKEMSVIYSDGEMLHPIQLYVGDDC